MCEGDVRGGGDMAWYGTRRGDGGIVWSGDGERDSFGRTLKYANHFTASVRETTKCEEPEGHMKCMSIALPPSPTRHQQLRKQV